MYTYIYTNVYIHVIYDTLYTMMSSMVQSERGKRCDALSAAEAEHSIFLYILIFTQIYSYTCIYTNANHIFHTMMSSMVQSERGKRCDVRQSYIYIFIYIYRSTYIQISTYTSYMYMCFTMMRSMVQSERGKR